MSGVARHIRPPSPACRSVARIDSGVSGVGASAAQVRRPPSRPTVYNNIFLI